MDRASFEGSGLGAKDPPRSCPSCGHDLSEHPYYQLVPSPVAKIVQKSAMALLPVMGLAYLVLLLFGDRPLGFGTGHGYLAVLVVTGPSLLLYASSRLIPKIRLVICQRCSWNHEFPDSRPLRRVA